MVEEERFVALKEVVEATEKELKAAKDGLTKRQEALEIALTTKLSKDMLEELEGEKIVKIRPCGDSESRFRRVKQEIRRQKRDQEES